MGLVPAEAARVLGGGGSIVRSVTDPAISTRPLVDGVTGESIPWSDPQHGERRLVTVLFIDLAHSSDVVADADPEDANDVVLPVIHIFVDVVEDMGGTVTQVLDDGVMAVFGAPAALEDHALKACRAAEKLRDQAQSGALAGSSHQGISFDVRIGISSGEVIAQIVRPDRAPEYRTSGEAVYLASRMEHLAKPNGIWITEDTVVLLRGRAEVRRLGRFSVAPGSRGKDFFELVDTRVAPCPRLVRTPTEMFGRSDELAAIMDLLADGRGGTVVIAGEPGIGKSRFIGELIKRAEASDHRTVAVAAPPPGFTSPNDDLAALVRGVLQLRGRIETPFTEAAIEGVLGTIGLGADGRVGDLDGALGDDRHRARPRVLEEQFERAVSLLGDAVFAISRTQPVLAGQGTVGLEIADQAGALGMRPDAVLVPCSGGGLVSGIATVMSRRCPGCVKARTLFRIPVQSLRGI